MERLCERTLTILNIVSVQRSAGTTVDGAGVDSSGFDGVRMAVQCSAFNGGGAAVDCKLQESDDNSAWSDVPGAAIVQQTAGTPIPTVDVRLGGRADRKKWVRARLAVSGGIAATAAVILDLYGAEAAAVVNTPAAVVV